MLHLNPKSKYYPTAKCDQFDYINFLVASPVTFTCTEAARCQPLDPDPPAHDAFSRLLRDLQPDPQQLWQEAQALVAPGGLLILDDTTIEKPYAHKMALVTRHWSGKRRAVVNGINLLTLLYTDGERHIPCDYRIYDKEHDGLSKNDHFRAMLKVAAARGLSPRYVCFDSWYASLDNLKAVREWGWHWFTRLKRNRLVNPDRSGNVALAGLELSAAGQVVHLQGYGMIKVFKIVAPDGDVEYWATDDEQMNPEQRGELAHQVWAIERYHLGLKQYCGVEGSHARGEVQQRNHIGMSIRAFLRLELARLRSGWSWWESKHQIVRAAIRAYLEAPAYTMLSHTTLHAA
jgi:putative transposase